MIGGRTVDWWRERLSDPRGREAISLDDGALERDLLEVLRGGDAMARFVAARMLLSFAHRPEVARALRPALDDPDSRVVAAAVASLGGETLDGLDEALVRLARHANGGVRLSVVNVMLWRGAIPLEVVPALLEDPISSVRAAVAFGVVGLGTAAAEWAPALVRLLDDRDADVAASAAASLARIGADPATIVRVLSDDRVRVAALRGLALTERSAPPEAMSFVLDALAAPDEYSRQSALIVLRYTEPVFASAIPRMRELLHGTSMGLRCEAALTMAALGVGADAAPRVASAARPDPQLARIAADALAAIGELGVPVHREATWDPRPQVRMHAVAVLGAALSAADLGPAARDARDALARAREDADPTVAEAARVALADRSRSIEERGPHSGSG